MDRGSGAENETVELSFISLAGFWETEPTRIAKAVIGLMERMLPRQEMVWGPALHQPQRSGPKAATTSDALEFICRDLDTGEYTAVFRGTNPISAIEWLFQDFMVQRMVRWTRMRPASPPARLSCRRALPSRYPGGRLRTASGSRRRRLSSPCGLADPRGGCHRRGAKHWQ